MTMERWRYGDPLTILLQKESGTCKGCVHVAIAFDRRYCDMGKKYGNRCKLYSDVKISQGKQNA